MDPLNKHEAEQLTERADLLMVSSDSYEAQSLLERAVSIDPTNQEARRMLDGLLGRRAAASGQTYVPGSFSSNAPPSIEPTTADKVKELLAQAREAENLSLFAREVTLLEKAVALDPSNADAQYLLNAARVRVASPPEPVPLVTPYTTNIPFSGLATPAGTARPSPVLPRALRFILGIVLGHFLINMPGRYHEPSMHDGLHLNQLGDAGVSFLFGLLFMLPSRRRWFR
jgi:hypothetical protein